MNTFESSVGTTYELIENVIIALVGSLKYNSWFLQKVPLDICPCDIPLRIKLDPNEFPLPSIKNS